MSKPEKVGSLCPSCGKCQWKAIQESLAQYCPCGFVRVQHPETKEFYKGLSLQKILADTYPKPIHVENATLS